MHCFFPFCILHNSPASLASDDSFGGGGGDDVLGVCLAALFVSESVSFARWTFLPDEKPTVVH